MKCVVLVIEVEKELCEKARKICASYDITLEDLLEQFVIFASKSENLTELKKILGIK